MSKWYKATFGIEPKLPLRCSMTDKEWNARQNRWHRRYPNLETWLNAHRGEAAGRLIGTVPPVVYCRDEKGKATCTQDLNDIRPRLTAEEFHAELFAPHVDFAGNPYCRAVYVPCAEVDGQPEWPPMPEEYVVSGMTKLRKIKRQTRPIPTTKDAALTDILMLMTGFGISIDEIQGPKQNGKPNGYAGRYEALAKSLANTSVRLPPFEEWIERVKAHENRT